jgi:ribonuclease VapC
LNLVLDTSALITYLTEELGWSKVNDHLANADLLIIGEPTILETHLVLFGKSYPAAEMTGAFLRGFPVRRDGFTQSHLEVATEAYATYGKGRHPARLNFRDCMSYATAKVADAPLLYCGDDFGKTDLNCIRV